jgi:ubiquinone/menaquinone biosynthesis C-methylase UbiE
MSGKYEFKERDFEHPSALFALEDVVKNLVGCFLLYNSYFKTFGLNGTEAVLDFGCGGGAGSKCLAKILRKGGNLTCIDTSKYWIGKAAGRLKKYPNTRCHAGDIRKSDIPDSSFDVISVIHVIHDIAPADRQETVRALSRKLKVGGAFFIRERIKESHGMPVDKIRVLLADSGLKEIVHKETKSEYMGKYQKID